MTMSTGNASCEAEGWVGEPPEADDPEDDCDDEDEA